MRILRRLGLAFLVFAIAVALCVFVHFHPKWFMKTISVARMLVFFPLAIVSAWIIVVN